MRGAINSSLHPGPYSHPEPSSELSLLTASASHIPSSRYLAHFRLASSYSPEGSVQRVVKEEVGEMIRGNKLGELRRGDMEGAIGEVIEYSEGLL